MKWFYEFFRWYAIVTGYLFQLVLFKRKTYYEDGARRRPWRRGGALIICNHYNFYDYMMSLFLVLPRKLYVVASEWSFRNKLITLGVRFFGAIKADRISGDMSFVEQSANMIRRGRIVQIFPEGRNTDDGELQAFKPSYILIANRAECPIIPIVTDGNYGFFKRVRVIVGKEIDLSEYLDCSSGAVPSKKELARVNDIVRNRMLDLRAQLESIKAAEKAKKCKTKEKQA